MDAYLLCVLFHKDQKVASYCDIGKYSWLVPHATKKLSLSGVFSDEVAALGFGEMQSKKKPSPTVQQYSFVHQSGRAKLLFRVSLFIIR